MNTQAIIATVGTILLFAVIVALAIWLKKKGLIEFKSPPFDPFAKNDSERILEDQFRRGAAPGSPTFSNYMDPRLPG